MRGAGGGPVTLNVQSFSEKSKHPFIHLDENRPSFRVKTDSLYQARALQKPCGSAMAMQAWLRHSPYMVLQVRCRESRFGRTVNGASRAQVYSLTQPALSKIVLFCVAIFHFIYYI
jgi:hypothetical protein